MSPDKLLAAVATLTLCFGLWRLQIGVTAHAKTEEKRHEQLVNILGGIGHILLAIFFILVVISLH